MKRRWQDHLIFIIGACLIASPWALGAYGSDSLPIGLAPYNFLVCGLLVAALGGAAYGSYHFWEDGVTLAVGCWLVVSPWALKFRDEAVPGAIAIIAGGALALLAVWVLVAKRSQGLEKR